MMSGERLEDVRPRVEMRERQRQRNESERGTQNFGRGPNQNWPLKIFEKKL